MVIKVGTAVKRLSKEYLQLEREKKTEPDIFRDYTAAPLEDNLFEWHFTVRGPRGTEFEGGKYHGKIILPQEYPFRPPSIILLTPNGRFALNKKICLSITGFHPEYWQPAWDIRSVLLAIISMFPTQGDGAIGAMYFPENKRRELAVQSEAWVCPACGSRNGDALPDPKQDDIQPPRATDREGETHSPVLIPGVSFAYEGDKSPSPNFPGAAGKNGEESSRSRDSVREPDSDGNDRPAAGSGPQPGKESPVGVTPAATVPVASEADAQTFAGSSTVLRTDESTLGLRRNRDCAPVGRPPDAEAADMPRPHERQEGRQRWRSWVLDLLIVGLICIIAERLAQRYYLFY